MALKFSLVWLSLASSFKIVSVTLTGLDKDVISSGVKPLEFKTSSLLTAFKEFSIIS